jgi:beta-1,4-mannosyltransferase
VCVVIRVLTCFNTKLIIDWHNYGFTIMQVSRRPKVFVWLAQMYEFLLGKFADYHLTVSQALRDDLKQRGIGNIDNCSSVVYDKATPRF